MILVESLILVEQSLILLILVEQSLILVESCDNGNVF